MLSRRSMLALAACIAICECAGLIGAVFTAGSADTWYRTIRRPAWTPPDWVFAPVWTALYATMGVAVWLVWQRRSEGDAKVAIGLFAAQLALNAAWAPLFFGLRQVRWAMVDLAALWWFLLGTMVAFWWVRRSACLLLTPYLAWTSFAAALNLSILLLNAA